MLGKPRSLRPPILAFWVGMTLCPTLTRAGNPAADIGRLLENLPQAQVTCSAQIIDLDSGKTIYRRNASTSMIPASNQKLWVMAAALDTFNPSDAFRTVLALRGHDLILIGDGDPTLGDPRLAREKGIAGLAFLDRWTEALRAARVTSIAGDFIVDATIFDNEFVHPDWEATDLVKWYGAPIGGLNLNNNCVELTVWPADKTGAPALWSLYPSCSVATVVNRCKSFPGAKRAVPTVGRRPGTFELVLSGKTSKRGTLQSISVPNPNQFAATAIRDHLVAAGISIAGEVRFARVREADGSLPENCRVVAEQKTLLPDVLRRIGRDSQNMCAEALLKRLGYEWGRAHHVQPPVGTWTGGIQAVNAFACNLGRRPSSLILADGSGLSRKNRASAADFVRLLSYMHRHRNGQVLLDSLAGNRNGGTLRKRLRGVAGDVFAKTGYMRGVRSLSGYVHSTAGRWYAFSILFNGFRGSSSPYNKIHREVCRILSDIPGNPAL